MKSSATKEKCFNCRGTGLDTFYPLLESMINSGAAMWLSAPDVKHYISRCPYCEGPPEEAPEFVDFFPTLI